jgi:hypothetical protein
MDIRTSLDFAADPAAVFTMLTDEKYLEEVYVASESISYAVSVSGSSTHTSRTLPAPDSVARFTGDQLTVIEDVNWGDAAADGARAGELTMTILGQPVKLTGALQLAPGGRGTVVNLTGELRVAIPLLGRKLEQAAAPAVLAGFETQQRVGDAWLTR